MKLELRQSPEYTGNGCPWELFVPRDPLLEEYKKDPVLWEENFKTFLKAAQKAAGALQSTWPREELLLLPQLLQRRTDCPGLVFTVQGERSVLVYDLA